MTMQNYDVNVDRDGRRLPRSRTKPNPDFADNRQSIRDDDREGHGPPPLLSIFADVIVSLCDDRRCPATDFPSLIGTVTATTDAAAAKTTVATEMEAPSLPSCNHRPYWVWSNKNRRRRSRPPPPSPRLDLPVNPIGKVDTVTVQINATTSSSWMAYILMATAMVDTVTGLIWDVNDASDTTAQTGGEILFIKVEKEECKSKYGIIWDIAEA